MVPTAKQLVQQAQRATDAASSSNSQAAAVLGKELLTLAQQTWATWMAFAAHPLDTRVAFAALAPVLGGLLNDSATDSEIRHHIVVGLSVLIQRLQQRQRALQAALSRIAQDSQPSALQQSLTLAADAVAADLREVAKFTGAFLPCLFNLYTTPMLPPDVAPDSPAATAVIDKQRAPVLRAIEAYLAVAELSLVNNFFKKVVSKVITSSMEQQQQQQGQQQQRQPRGVAAAAAATMASLVELAQAFVPYMDAKNASLLHRAVEPSLQHRTIPGGHHYRHQHHDAAAVASAALEKKSFKVLRALCEKQPENYLQHHMEAVLQIMSNHIRHASKAAADNSSAPVVWSAHLGIIGALASNMTPEALVQWLRGTAPNDLASPMPFVVFGFRDASARVRATAHGALRAMAERLRGVSGDADAADASGIHQLISLLVIGLGGQSAEFQGGTLAAIGFLMREFSQDLVTLEAAALCSEFHGQNTVGPVTNLIKTGTVLLEWNAMEVRQQALRLLIACVRPAFAATSSAAQTLDQAPGSLLSRYAVVMWADVVRSLFGWPEQIKSKLRTEFKHLFERLLRRFGASRILELTPGPHRKFINNLRKTLERQKRKQPASKDAAAAEKGKKGKSKSSKSKSGSAFAGDGIDRDVDDDDDGADSASGDDDNWMSFSDNEDDDTDAAGKSKRDKSKSKRDKSGAPTATASGNRDVWVREGADDDAVLDFLDPQAAHRFVSINPARSKGARNAGKDVSSSSSFGGFTVSDDGRFIVDDADDDDDHGDGRKGRKANRTSGMDMDVDGDDDGARKKRKRRMGSGDSSDEDSDHQDAPQRQPQQRPASATAASSAKRSKLNSGDKHEKQAANSSKTQPGDAKRRGAKFEPYAYVPLNPKFLNKRRRQGAAKQYESVVAAAKKGARTKRAPQK
jgi:ribosomal RNA-processing protein 12